MDQNHSYLPPFPWVSTSRGIRRFSISRSSVTFVLFRGPVDDGRRDLRGGARATWLAVAGRRRRGTSRAVGNGTGRCPVRSHPAVVRPTCRRSHLPRLAGGSGAVAADATDTISRLRSRRGPREAARKLRGQDIPRLLTMVVGRPLPPSVNGSGRIKSRFRRGRGIVCRLGSVCFVFVSAATVPGRCRSDG